MLYSADLATFLFDCAIIAQSNKKVTMCIEKNIFFGVRATMCRKIAFFVLCTEILLSRHKGVSTRVCLDSRAGPFLGSVKKYWFFVKIFTSGFQFSNTKKAAESVIQPNFPWGNQM